MISTNTPATYWNHIIRSFKGVHLLQTWEWGHVKAQFGWLPLYALWMRDGSHTLLEENEIEKNVNQSKIEQSQDIIAATLILKRVIPVRGFAKRMCVLYAPKGPLLDWTNRNLIQQVINDLQTIARRHGAIFLKIDPDVRLGSGIPGSLLEILNPIGHSIIEQLQSNHWRFSNDQIQFRNTCVIDLTHSEEELLVSMKQKTRYNLRLAERKGVNIRYGSQSDIPLLYNMYVETSHRDGFFIRDESYYQTLLKTFMANPLQQSQLSPVVQPLIAEVQGEPVAAIVVFIFAGKAWYLFGMSREVHREKMPNYLLQWEAIRLAKGLDCQVYDLWGAPDQFNETDSLWGVFRFKEGLGGVVIRHIGAWDYPVQPLLYRLYTQILPRILNIMRQRQKNHIQRMVE